MPRILWHSLCGRYVADGLEQAKVVEPRDPFKRGRRDCSWFSSALGDESFFAVEFVDLSVKALDAHMQRS